MSEEAPKLRLRPKLPADASAASPSPVAPSSSRPPVPPEASSNPPVPGSRPKPRLAGEPGSRPPQGTRPPGAIGATPPPFVVAMATPPPVPVATTSAPTLPPLPPDTVPPMPLPAVAPPAPPELAPFEERARKTRRAAVGITAAGALCFAGVAYFAFPKLVAQQKEFEAMQRLEERFAVEETPEPVKAVPPPPDPTPIEPPPARKATTRPPSPQPSVPTSTGAGPPLDLPTLIGTGETVRTATGAEGSPNFQAWVRNVKITGLRTGANPRILIGGESFDVGDTVSIEFGIRFEGYDSHRRVLRFRDATGVILERRHP